MSEDLVRELASVQLELESARGARAVELWEVEHRLLVEHKHELFGPLAKVAFQFGLDTVLWRRGHIDGVHAPADRFGREGRTEHLSAETLRAAFDHPSMARCRDLHANRWPKRAPASLERLSLRQAVVTESVLALEHLRELRVDTPVASVPLRHPRLATLGLVLHPGVASALAQADLPSLETLALRGVHYFPLDLDELSSTLAGLRAKRFFLGIRGNDTRGLEPIADRIEGLSLASLPARWDLSLPRLSRLALTIPQEEAAGPRLDLGALPSARELLLTVEAGREALTAMGEALAASELVKNLRALHLVCKKPLAPFGQSPLENLEELSLPEGSLMAVEAARPLFAGDAFPAVRTLTLGDDRLLGDVARSPLAARIEVLALAIPNFQVARMWGDVRASFPKLKTLVVRAWNFLRPVERAMVIEGDHEIVFAEHHVWASRRFFGAPGGDPGFVMRA